MAPGAVHARSSTWARRMTSTSSRPAHRGPDDWSIQKSVRTTRRYRTVQIRAGHHLLTAEDPLPDDLRNALARIAKHRSAH